MGDYIGDSLSSPVNKTTGIVVNKAAGPGVNMATGNDDQINYSVDIVGNQLGSPLQKEVPKEEGSGMEIRGGRRRSSVTVITSITTEDTTTTMNPNTLTTTCAGVSVNMVSLERNINGAAVAVPIITVLVLAAIIIAVCWRRKKRKKSISNPSYFSAIHIDTSSVIQNVELNHVTNDHVYEDTDIGNPTELTSHNGEITPMTNVQLEDENNINNSNIYLTLEPDNDIVLDTNITDIITNKGKNHLSTGSKPNSKYINTEVNPTERHENHYFVLEKEITPSNNRDIKKVEMTNEVVERDNMHDHIYNQTNETEIVQDTSGHYSKLDRRFVVLDDPKLSTYNTMQVLGV